MLEKMPGFLYKLIDVGYSVLEESGRVYLALLKILIPAIVIVKILQETGAVVFISDLLAPLMNAVGLPPVLSVVWATTMLTNIYTGMVIFYSVASGESLTVAQVTVLGSMMLLSHSIIVEGAVSKRIGVPWWLTLLSRVAGAYVFGILLHFVFKNMDILQQNNELLWRPETTGSSLQTWAIVQVKAIALAFFIILFLVTVLRIVRFSGLDGLMHWLMRPLLVFIGVRSKEVTRSLSEMTVVGATLGLTYGAGLLIRQRDSGTISSRNSRVVGSFIGVCHGLIDDTLLVLLLGAKLNTVLFVRVLFALLLIAWLTRMIDWIGALKSR